MNMTIGFTRKQELAAEQLQVIRPLIQPARKSFINLYELSTANTAGIIEAPAMHAALTLAKAVLCLNMI